MLVRRRLGAATTRNFAQRSFRQRLCRCQNDGLSQKKTPLGRRGVRVIVVVAN
jgi:hypothetical protein